jgi:hypothetical protein
MVLSSNSLTQKETATTVERTQLTITERKTKARYDNNSIEYHLKFSPMLIKETLSKDKKRSQKTTVALRPKFDLNIEVRK